MIVVLKGFSRNSILALLANKAIWRADKSSQYQTELGASSCRHSLRPQTTLFPAFSLPQPFLRHSFITLLPPAILKYKSCQL